MTDSTRFLFVHIPKTAGISLFNVLADAVGHNYALRFANGSDNEKQEYISMPDNVLRGFKLLSGHFSLPFFLRRQIHDYKIISLIRNPVDRELSAYFYIKTWEIGQAQALIKDWIGIESKT